MSEDVIEGNARDRRAGSERSVSRRDRSKERNARNTGSGESYTRENRSEEMVSEKTETGEKTGLAGIAETAADGFFMAAADSVPGVSGGTVAFILGFYDHFIGSIHDLLSRDSRKRRDSLGFLLRLGIGWAIGMVIFMLVLAGVFESNIYLLSSLFLGLTAAAVPVILHDEYKSVAGRPLNLVFATLGFAVVCGLSLMRGQASILPAEALTGLSVMQYGYLFVSGMLAISAMVLPGISGSTLLLVMGAYLPVVFSVRELLHMNFSVFPALLVFGIGVLTGAAVSVRYIKLALERYRSQMVYLILGLVIGSSAAIIKGPTTMSTPLPPLGISNFNFIGFAAGILIIFGLEAARMMKNRKVSSKTQSASER